MQVTPTPWIWGSTYDDPECSAEWEQFCALPEERQNEVLAEAGHYARDSRPGRRTRKLDKSTRDLLRRHSDKHFCKETIIRLRVFANGVGGDELRIELPDEAAVEKSLQVRVERSMMSVHNMFSHLHLCTNIFTFVAARLRQSGLDARTTSSCQFILLAVLCALQQRRLVHALARSMDLRSQTQRPAAGTVTATEKPYILVTR